MNRREFLLATLASGLATTIGCESDTGLSLPSRENDHLDFSGLTLIARFAHVTDTHMVDDESPARYPAAHIITTSAWRPYEAYASQIFDGILRTVNRIHASGRPIDFLLHTGDGCDNAQFNELAWLLDIFDGRMINPLTGPDDRPAGTRPAPAMDPYAPFRAAGLYRSGVHGELASIPWYVLSGNHDSYAIGVFPFFDQPFGGRAAPLPPQPRPGIVLPGSFDPTGSSAHGNVTPANPGPPPILQAARFVEPNPDRAFFDKGQFVQRMFETETGPAGHGLSDEAGRSWYSVSPAPGLRLIGLDTSDPAHKIPTLIYVEAAISPAQMDFLRAELEAATARDEIVIVATHHPSSALQEILGTVLSPEGFRDMLHEYPNVALHLCGHTHRNRVTDWGTYLEIETCSTIDLPQEGRLIELYRDETTGEVSVSYEMFSHLDDALPPLGDDPLRELRVEAMAIAASDAGAAARQLIYDPSGVDPAGTQRDRTQ